MLNIETDIRKASTLKVFLDVGLTVDFGDKVWNIIADLLRLLTFWDEVWYIKTDIRGIFFLTLD